MKKYKQSNYEDRIVIQYRVSKNMSIWEISRMLRHRPNTISRELKKKRITVKGTYFAESTEREFRRKKLNNKNE